MSAYSYTANRNFIPTDLSITAIDISILASDDSFNSAGGDFAGLISGYWVLVSGSAVDDGWHQLLVDSTSGKITTTSTLTDETAGSSITIIGYKHGLNEVYDLEIYSQILNPIYKSKTKKSESLSGVVETLLLNEIEYWDITTGEITEAELPYWLEFFSSVKAGEVFSFDPYGTIALPDNVKTCIIEGDQDISRIETSDGYYISFKVRTT